VSVGFVAATGVMASTFAVNHPQTGRSNLLAYHERQRQSEMGR
jgi:hypothetical protein